MCILTSENFIVDIKNSYTVKEKKAKRLAILHVH